MQLYLKTMLLGGFFWFIAFGLPWVTGVRIPSDVLEVFFGLFGGCYAIIVGFVIFMAIDSFYQVKRLVAAEVNALQDLRDFLLFVDPDPDDPSDTNRAARDSVRSALVGYLQHVVHTDWPAMVAGKRQTASFRDTPPAMIQLMQAVNRIRVGNASDEVALTLMVQTLAQITTYRTDRLAAAGSRLPPALRQLLLWLSLVAVVVFSFFGIESVVVQTSLNAAISFSIAFIYHIVMDLNDPFSGNWSIEKDDFVDLLGRLQ